MDIGKPQRIIHVEPATTPVPQRERTTTPRREPIRRTEPTPTKTPERVPEKG